LTAPTVELASCSKRFGERVALRRVDLAVAAGEIVAVVGANGSGKSTLLRIVAGLVRPTAGRALIDGVDAGRLTTASRRVLGFLGHEAMAWRGLTAGENLELIARLYRLEPGAATRALDAVGLVDRANDRIDGFSRGMVQRLALARTFLHDPALVLLDEPTTGLDADGLELVARLLDEGRGRRTVVLSTHDAAFAARVAGRDVRLVGGEVAR
jgi:heme ABC exporter ATP-binding subunit CcmA